MNRVTLGSWPTPVQAVPRLATAIGLGADDLWLKRDDLVGLGAGGNKVRKLEYTLGAAVANGATAVVTTGAAQSNHARATAAAAAALGLRAVLVLGGDPPASPVGNVLLDALFGARLVFAGPADDAGLAARADAEADRLRAAGETVEVVPFGGSSVVGARAYADAGAEIEAQVPGVATVVTAVGSGGTMAGLVTALGPDRVLGVDCGAVPDPAARVAALAPGTDPCALTIRGDQVGAGYAVLTDAVRDAIGLVARTEGVVLDPVYTGRAAAGLVAAVADGTLRAGRRVVLLHSGGLPGLFGHPQAAELASSLP
ncbi:pyridoxal-phosphate dependent enzyme [Cryptosporangium phraense]|uniref:Pyridoxal-phosphate dependent enzyme n=1 Tax=Cryptosporangium phraense TaxID=2593070 RepID=A0A545ATS0_9ACTN|nr:pyridoxal-phosphate dependent enzyme [Cryptosporangium phraense]TQS44714.1 pyridoxal-phosphate dependent enzyme [Cryptosporangium phraense]